VLVVWKCVMASVGLVVGSAARRYCLMHNDVHVLQVENGQQALLLLGRCPFC
jgi:hypothetical protein